MMEVMGGIILLQYHIAFLSQPSDILQRLARGKSVRSQTQYSFVSSQYSMAILLESESSHSWSGVNL